MANSQHFRVDKGANLQPHFLFSYSLLVELKILIPLLEICKPLAQVLGIWLIKIGFFDLYGDQRNRPHSKSLPQEIFC